MRTPTLSVLAVTLALMAGAPGVFAFTIVQNNGTNPDGTPRFSDPDEKLDGLMSRQGGGAGVTTLQSGRTTFQFGLSPSYGGGYGANSRFLDSPAGRTVPSQGLGFFLR